MKKHITTFFIAGCFFSTLLHGQTYTGNNQNEAMIVRAPVWVLLEPQPGTMRKKERPPLLPPRQALINLSKMILGGMTYGWTFHYIPFDKKRNIKESFELTPVHTIENIEKRLLIKELTPKYPYLYCWAEYHASSTIAQRRKRWLSCTYITAKGFGTGERKDELSGIHHAYQQAVLSAVRSSMRKKIKNKPHSITGEVLIKSTPRLYLSSGEFNAELTVYLYIKEIIPYTVF